MTDPIGSVEPTSGKVYRATRWSMVASVVGQGGRLVTFLFLARLLSPEDFGLMAMAFVIIGFLNVIRNLGTGAAIIQRDTLSTILLDSVFWLNITSGLVLGVAVVSFAWAGALAFDEPLLTPVLQALAIGFVIGTAGVLPRALLQRRMQFQWIAVADIVSMLAFALTALPLAVRGFGVWSLVIGTIVSEFVLTLMNWIAARWKPRLRCDVKALRSIWKFSSNLTLSQIVSYFLWQSDRIIIGRFLGSTELGIYSIANRLLGFSVQFLIPQLHSVLFPALSRVNDVRIRSGFVRAECGIAMVVFPLIIGVGVVGPTFVDVFLSPEWALAAVLLPILAVRYVLQSILQGVGTLYQVKGRTDLLLYWQIGSGLVFLASYLAGLPWGLVGVATAQSMAIMLLAYPGFAVPFRLIGQKLSDLLRELKPHVIGNLVMVFATVAYLGLASAYGVDQWIQLGGGIVVGVLTYGVMTLTLRPKALTDLKGLIGR